MQEMQTCHQASESLMLLLRIDAELLLLIMVSGYCVYMIIICTCGNIVGDLVYSRSTPPP